VWGLPIYGYYPPLFYPASAVTQNRPMVVT
jgi:hypothetical protein